MTDRRSFLGGLAALPLVGPAQADPTRHIIESFEPIDFTAPGPNAEWAEAYLPPIRMATVVVTKSKAEMIEAFDGMDADTRDYMLEAFHTIAEDFLDYVALLQIARERCLYLLDRSSSG